MKNWFMPIGLLVASGLVGNAAELTITWLDNSDNEDGFILERSINGSDFLPIWQLAPDETSYLDGELLPAVEYWYRVKAFNQTGNSGYSNTASAITPAIGTLPNDPGTLDLSGPGRLTNISSRGLVAVGAGVVVGGFVIQDGPIAVLIRAVGPTIGADPYNVPGALADPTISLLMTDGTPIVGNDDWSGQDIADAAAAVGAFALPAGSKDAALLIELPPGAYTVHVAGTGGETGIALLEIYQAP